MLKANMFHLQPASRAAPHRDLGSCNSFSDDGSPFDSWLISRPRRVSESSTASSSMDSEHNFESDGMECDQCPVCYEELDATNVASLAQSCAHTFCLPCILRWSRVRQLCPMCQAEFTHVTSHYMADGSFHADPLTTTVEWMVRWTWLDTDFIESPTMSPKMPREEGMVVERDIYGTYNWDEFDDEYDLANFAPSRGKDGRRRKSDAGCVSVTPTARSLVERQGPNQQARRQSEQTTPTSGSQTFALQPSNSANKLGRRARRALMRRLADEKSTFEPDFMNLA